MTPRTTTTYAPAIPGGRPAMPTHDAELVDDWMTPNGVVGWIPDGSAITVAGGQITWPRWRHLDADSDPWDRDVMIAADLIPAGQVYDTGEGNVAVVDERTVPVQVPVTDRVRELFRLTDDLNLVER